MVMNQVESDTGHADDLSSASHSNGRHDGLPASLSGSSPDGITDMDGPPTKKRRTTAQYRRILKETIQEILVRPQSDDLEASYIGASYWTAQEKSQFFDTLTRQADLAAIAQSIRTKSSIEVRSYLLALQEAASEKPFADYDQEAAFEISFECEEALSKATLQLAQNMFVQDCKQEKEQYGVHWVIDRERAWILDGKPDELIPSAGLLEPSTMIELSRNVFMNENVDGIRYDVAALRAQGTEGPGIFRSAFDKLHDLCVQYTTKLVTAAHFQALTRVRAHSDERIKPTVRAVDVRTALDIMGIPQPDCQAFWTKKMRQYKVDVYSEARGYNDGRTHMRGQGYLLTSDEVRRATQAEEAEPAPDAEEDESDGSTDEEAAESSDEGSELYEKSLIEDDARTSRKEENVLRQIVGLAQLEEPSMQEVASDTEYDEKRLSKQDPVLSDDETDSDQSEPMTIVSPSAVRWVEEPEEVEAFETKKRKRV